jgi:hypothetical protein
MLPMNTNLDKRRRRERYFGKRCPVVRKFRKKQRNHGLFVVLFLHFPFTESYNECRQFVRQKESMRTPHLL